MITMDEQGPTKTCRACKKDIHLDARKCPFCQQWQGAYRLLFVLPVALVLFYLGFSYYSMRRLDSSMSQRGRLVHEMPPDLVIDQVSMYYNEEPGYPTITTVAIIKNIGRTPWRYLRLEARYYNQGGELIDSATQPSMAAIYPGQEFSFRIQQRAARNKAQYARSDLQLIEAEEATKGSAGDSLL
jgi:hypothetical protein